MDNICILTIKIIPGYHDVVIRIEEDRCISDILDALEKRYNKKFFMTVLESYNDEDTTFLSIDPQTKVHEVKGYKLISIPTEWID